MSEEQQEIVPLVTESGEELDMVVVIDLEEGDEHYALLEPADIWVDVVRVAPEEEGGDFEQLEPSEFSTVSKAINEALGEWNVRVVEHADELLLVGDPPPEFFEDCPELDVEDDEEEPSLYVVLMEVDTGGSVYLVTTNVEQRVFPVRMVDGRGHLLEDEEFAKLHERFQAALQAVAEEEEEEA